MPHCPTNLAKRLDALGVTLIGISADGRVCVNTDATTIERLLGDCPAFSVAVKAQFQQLAERPGTAQEVWPGVWLVPMPADRKRRLSSARQPSTITAIILISPELLTSDHFRLLCDQAQQDYQATCSRVNSDRLIARSEVARLASMITWMHADTVQMDRRDSELHSLSKELAESYEELSLLYKFSTNITVTQAPDTFLTEACAELQQVSDLRWMALQLPNDLPRLPELAGQIFTSGELDCDNDLLRRIGQQLMQKAMEPGRPVVIDDTTTLGIPFLPRIAKSLLIVPLVVEQEPIGLLYGAEKCDGSHISSVDSKLCNSLANSISIFLENLVLYGDMQGMFLGTLQALTSAIDAKDSYTHGHSERVALMSRMLAEAAGLDEHTCERVYIAGLVHDVGKIGVPESVLCKPGRLTDEEFELIKMHPEIGGKILQDIPQMQDLIPGVMYHHERWDGRGYPHKLEGESIPLFGRLICLADSFDAMSSNRTYRRSLSHQDVLEEIQRCAGAQFDPELAEVFTQMDFAPFFQMLAKHQPDANDPELRKAS